MEGHTGVRKRHKLERSKGKNLCLAPKVIERENPSIFPPTVGIKNA